MKFPNTERVIQEFATTIQRDWKTLLESKGYSNSPLKDISFTIKEKDLIYTIKLSVVDYFHYFDKGRGPGKQPPLEPIEKWIVKYNIIPKQLTLKSGKTVIPSQKSLAFLIARSIGRKGTKGKFWWDALLNDIIEKYTVKIAEAVEQDIAESLEKELE